MLAGESAIDAGQLVLEKGARVALHDQRPPREREVSLRDYVLSGCGELVALEHELARLEAAMGAGASDAETLEGYSRAQARLELVMKADVLVRLDGVRAGRFECAEPALELDQLACPVAHRFA